MRVPVGTCAIALLILPETSIDAVRDVTSEISAVVIKSKTETVSRSLFVTLRVTAAAPAWVKVTSVPSSVTAPVRPATLETAPVGIAKVPSALRNRPAAASPADGAGTRPFVPPLPVSPTTAGKSAAACAAVRADGAAVPPELLPISVLLAMVGNAMFSAGTSLYTAPSRTTTRPDPVGLDTCGSDELS